MNENATNEARVAHFIRWWWGWAVACLIVFALSQPLLTLADPVDLQKLGFAVGSTVIFGYAEAVLPGGVARACKAAAICCGIFSFYLAAVTIAPAIEHSESNDARCLLIEREMLRGKPRRDDLPDMFQAFGCQPQTNIMPRRPAPEPSLRPKK